MWPFKQKPTSLNVTPKEEAEVLCVRLANTCVKSAQDAYGVTLDYTLSSLDGLETILQAMHEENRVTPISDQGLSARCFALGSYLGEVVRREVKDGNWSRDSAIGENTFPMIFRNTQDIFPMGWARKRILNGPGDNVVFKAKVMLSTLQGEGPFAEGAIVDR